MPNHNEHPFEKLEEDTDFVNLLQAVILLMGEGENTGTPIDDDWVSFGVEWLPLAQDQTRKIVTHLMSLFYLRKGTHLPELPIENVHISFFDHSSASIITRAALEGYLLFYTVFVNPKTDGEKLFLIKIWDLGDLLTRSRGPIYSEDSKIKKKEIEQRILKKRIEIERSSFFNQLSKIERKRALKGEWRLGKSWREIAIDAGFSEVFFTAVYGTLSSDAHSGKSSVIKTQENITKEGQLERFNLLLKHGLIILSRIIDEYPKLFQDASLELPPKEIQDRALLWREVLKTM